jgi:hypothetical protein
LNFRIFGKCLGPIWQKIIFPLKAAVKIGLRMCLPNTPSSKRKDLSKYLPNK